MLKKIIKNIKQGTLLVSIRSKLYIRKHINSKHFNEKKYLIGLGKIKLKYSMNLDNPQTFNEKLNWYKLNYKSPLINKVVDKIDAKEYVASKGLSDIIVETYGCYDNVDAVDFSNLPNQFVLKNTLDSGGVYVCKDKSHLDKKLIREKLSAYHKEVFNGKHWALENVYTNEKNRIIAEKLIDTPDGHAPWDYKFFCFNGEPKFLFVGTDRDTEVCFDFFDIEFNHLEIKQIHPNSKKVISKPKNYERMIEICKVLSKDFPHVRVDLYNIDGTIYFGELTFYHFAALEPFSPKEWDYKFGQMFDISKINCNGKSNE